MKHIKKINELFNNNDDIYDVISDGKVIKFGTGKTYRYYFITKDDVKYRILLVIKDDGRGKLDFDTIGLKNPEYDSIYDKINTKDSIKVFNTLKWIIFDKHKEIKKLIVSSGEERLIFYKKLLKYLGVETEEDKYGNIIATIK